MKFIIHFLLLISLQVGCHHHPEYLDNGYDHKDKNPQEHHHLPLAEEAKKFPKDYTVVSSNTEFAFRLYQQIASDAAAKNIFFSPLSISIAFALLTLGAKSETKDEIYKGLAFNLINGEEREMHEEFQQLIRVLNRPTNKVQVNIGNALFMEESLKFLPTFLEDAKTMYEAEGFSTDFNVSRTAKKQINDYVRNKTHGKIAHVLEDLESSTVMVLVNYIFFKASWLNPFDTLSIMEKDFFIDANTTIPINFMIQKGHYKVFRDNDLSCWIVNIPYKGDAAALFILPDEGKLKHVEESLGKETLSKWRSSFTYKNIRLLIPKFSICASYDVKDFLQRMGVTAVFNDTSNLSGITGECNLKVSKAIHKTFLDVNESGTEAAAVTTMEFKLRSAQIHPLPTIAFNKPFNIIITDQITCSILFIGKIVNPTQH